MLRTSLQGGGRTEGRGSGGAIHVLDHVLLGCFTGGHWTNDVSASLLVREGRFYLTPVRDRPNRVLLFFSRPPGGRYGILLGRVSIMPEESGIHYTGGGAEKTWYSPLELRQYIS